MINERIKLFDGYEDDLFKKSFNINIINQECTFKARDIYESELNQLSSLISKDSFDNLLDLFQFKSMQFDQYTLHKSEENLQGYFIIKNGQALIFSMGEFQNSRYMLFYEGAWKI